MSVIFKVETIQNRPKSRAHIGDSNFNTHKKPDGFTTRILECPCWSKYPLEAHVILLVLSRFGKYLEISK